MLVAVQIGELSDEQRQRIREQRQLALVRRAERGAAAEHAHSSSVAWEIQPAAAQPVPPRLTDALTFTGQSLSCTCMHNPIN